MTQDRFLKRAIRERMAATGEKYTTARRALTDDGGDVDAVTAALTPGTVTALVCAGGATNFALVLPSLLSLIKQGHPLFVVAHGSPDIDQLPSPLDFVVALGLASPDAVATSLMQQDRALVEELTQVFQRIRFVEARTPVETWRDLLPDGAAPIIWVQDIQVDGPLSVPAALSDFDEIPAQLAGLLELARSAGAIVGIGHCTSYDDEYGRRIVTDAVDAAFVVDEVNVVAHATVPREIRLHHFAQGRATTVERRWLRSLADDDRRDWRLHWYERRRAERAKA